MNILMTMKHIQDLTHGERQVVNFILNDPAAAENLGIADLAQQSYTSTGTIMRLCRKLGLDGFADFRRQLAADMRAYIESAALLTYQDPAQHQEALADVVEKVTDSNVRAVLDVKRFNSLDALQRVVDMMSRAAQIDFIGSGVSNLICHDAMIKAMRIGIPSTAYSFYSEMAMLARTCPTDHLAIILSYTGQTEDTLRAATYLQKAGVPSVSITSHTENALLALCTVNLFVDSCESIYRIGGMGSRLSSLHLIDILFSAFINQNQAKLRETIRTTFLPETFHHLGMSLEE